MLAISADIVVGIDKSPAMLKVALSKGLPNNKVVFLNNDAYQLENVEGSFDIGVANFWFSHIPKSEISSFMSGFHLKVGSGNTIFMADNVYVPGLGGELVRKPGCENTYKNRVMEDGSTWQIIKNYYDEASIRKIFKHWTSNLQLYYDLYYWWLHYTIGNPRSSDIFSVK